jgi:hypothetical protein
MYIINELWNIIKEYLIHNIKNQGKHLNKKNIIKNKTFKNLLNEFKIPYYNYYIWDKPGKYKLVLHNLHKRNEGILLNWNYPYWEYPY